jgi:hypothetical protein
LFPINNFLFKDRHTFIYRCIQLLALVALALSLKRDVAFELHPAKHMRPYDFRATYCGEYVTAHGGNPYLSQPLRDCEVSMEHNAVLPLPNQALPATLPPYAQIIFSPLGYLDSIKAQTVFYTVSFIVFLSAIWAVAQLSALPLAVVTVPLIFGLYVQSSKLGAIAVLAFAGLAFTALFYERKQYAACAVAACVTMLQPQTGLVLFAALFVSEARMRIPIAIAAVFLALCSLPVGYETALSYIQSLGVHARAEEYQNTQLSLTFLARHLGMSEPAAAMLGSCTYLIWFACAVVYARFFAPNNAFRVLVPAMIAVLPASFVQTIYLAGALIPALILIRRNQSSLALFGIALLSIAWQPIEHHLSWNLYLGLSILGACLLAVFTLRTKQVAWIVPSIAVGALGFCAAYIHQLPLEHALPMMSPEPRFASAEWYAYRVAQYGPFLDIWMQKLTFVGGLLCIVIAALRNVRPSDPFPIVQVERGEFVSASAVAPLVS